MVLKGCGGRALEGIRRKERWARRVEDDVHETFVESEDCDETHNTKREIRGCHTFDVILALLTRHLMWCFKIRTHKKNSAIV